MWADLGATNAQADHFTTVPGMEESVMPKEGITARSARQSREGNSNWRGGRSIASNGYVLVRVGVDHPMADVRGYAYEHRIVASATLGRPLLPGELVHHRNGIKTDNRPENLEVCEGNAEHFVRHRRRSAGLRMPDEENVAIACACGCGTMLEKYDSTGRPRRFVSGHNMRARGRG